MRNLWTTCVLNVCLSCQFSADGLDGLAGYNWQVTVRDGNASYLLPAEEPTPVDNLWACTAEKPHRETRGSSLVVTCESGDTEISMLVACTVDDPKGVGVLTLGDDATITAICSGEVGP